MRIRILLITFMIAVRVFRVEGQTAPQVPKAPDVAALEKYIDFPVEKSTGTVNVSIPIYTLSIKNFNLPISLNYHTGGIKVDEMANNCGLGWALVAGGTLSRTIKSYPDEGAITKTTVSAKWK